MSMPRSRPTTGSPQIEAEPLRYRQGDVIADKYRLDELLGEGGMGTVWRARNLALEADVALKLVHGEMLNEETTTRLRQEAHAAARLEHPSAVRVFDLGDTPLGDSFIVMELLRGRSLRALLEENGPLSPTDAVALLLPVASALVAAHAKGIVHRDLKPDNVMLVEGEAGTLVPKVVDFGIAKVDAGGLRGSTTAAGSILGSPDYMSPEQARGDVARIDARSDVWSFGVVLFETVVGKPPFEALHPLALIRAIIEQQPPTLESLGVGDAKLSLLVGRALAKNIDDRWPDMRSMARALAEWAIARGLETDVTGISLALQWTRSSSLGSFGSNPNVTNPFLLRTAPDPLAASAAAPAPPKRDAPPSPSVPKAEPRRRWPLFAGAALVALGGAASFAALRDSPRDAATTAGSAALPAPSTAQRDGAAPSDPTPGPSPAPSALASPSAPEPAAAASARPAVPDTPAPPGACIASLFPDASFGPDPRLERVCSEGDTRRAAGLLRSEIARKGVGASTTEAMRTWALLSWYELAAVGFVQGSCCGASRSAPELPASLGACPDLGAAVDAIARAAHQRADLDAPLSAFRTAVMCAQRGFHANPSISSPYAYRGPPGGGAESAFRKIASPAR